MHRLLTSLVVCALCATTPQTSAQTMILGDAVPLNELVAGDTMAVGELVFSGFSYASVGDMPPAEQINAIPIVDRSGKFGIRFQGGFGDLPGSGASDALITYSVTANAPAQITGACLVGNPSVSGGPGVAAVTETFLPLFPGTSLSVIGQEPGDDVTMDEALFDTPVDAGGTLSVQKDVLLVAGDGSSGAASISFIDQTFSASAILAEIPTVSEWGLIMLGLLLLVTGTVFVRREIAANPNPTTRP